MRLTLLITIIVLIWLLVSTMDYEDEQQEARQYIHMVCSGAWPDYKQLNPECGSKSREQSRY